MSGTRISCSMPDSKQCNIADRVWKSIPAESERVMRSIGWSAILRENGIRSGLITAGSSSIYGIGAPPTESKGWRVAIKHPKDPGQSVEEVFLKDMSMSTSGNYEKFFRVGRKGLQPYHGPTHWLSGAGHAAGFGRNPENTRQRSVDQAILH